MPVARVLVVEDDSDLRRLLRKGLTEEGFEVVCVAGGAEAIRVAGDDPPDVLVVDIGLPDSDGRDVCQALRARGLEAPVVFLTARDAVVDRVSGFRVGGDDYVTKPFALVELVARLHALLRRSGSDAGNTVGNLRLDPVTHAAVCERESEALTPTEFRLLATLAARAGEAVRRHELTRAAWPDGAIVHDNTLDVYVARLRRKLTRLPTKTEIHTVHGVGYQLR
jgi:two-component system, OmpR family, response regulator